MSQKNKNLLQERLKGIQSGKENVQGQNPGRVIEELVRQEEEKPDFARMAEVLESQKEEKKSLNDGYTKDTLYIRDDLYNAMQSLCVKLGDKKNHVNKAYELYLTKVYNERKEELNIDK